MKCNVCGSTNLIEGRIRNSSGEATHIFKPSKGSFFKKILGLGSREIYSYACVRCNNLQFVVDFNEKDKKQYLEFEGEQPSLMERLAEESSQPK